MLIQYFKKEGERLRAKMVLVDLYLLRLVSRALAMQDQF